MTFLKLINGLERGGEGGGQRGANNLCISCACYKMLCEVCMIIADNVKMHLHIIISSSLHVKRF